MKLKKKSDKSSEEILQQLMLFGEVPFRFVWLKFNCI